MYRSHTWLVVALLTLLAGCGTENDRSTDKAGPGAGANGRRDLVRARADIGGVKAGQSYADYDHLRDHKGAGLAFADYGCMSDCGDLIEGYRSAKKANLSEVAQCTGASWGIVEGCVAFVQGEPPSLSNVPPLKEQR